MVAFFRTHRAAALGALLSLLLTAWIPLTNRSRNADLSNWYSDHLHHPFATWVGLTKGLVVYTEPFARVFEQKDSAYPHEQAGSTWGEMPGMAYPPGVFAVFLPTALLGRYVPMDRHAFGLLNILYLLLLTHLSFFAVLVALEALAPGARELAGLFTWLLMVSMASEGFYDPLFLGVGALGLRALARGEPEAALRWFCAAALLHFRAAPFAPFAAVALWRMISGRPRTQWPWRTLVVAALSAVLVVGSFILMYPATSAFRATHGVVLAGRPLAHQVVWAVSVAAVLAAAWFSDLAVAASVAVCLGLTLVERQPYWWHQAMLLGPLLGVGAVKTAPRAAGLTRAIMAGWMLALGPLVWTDASGKATDQPTLLFLHFVNGYKGAP
jgi:hypothetical protein